MSQLEHVKQESRIKHTHSKNCTVYEYPMTNDSMNLAVAEITQRYPDQGYALNHTCHEMGYILKGSGKLVTEKQELCVSAGDAVYIPAGEKYYWEGDVTLLLPSTPPWHPEQYSTVEK